MNMRTSKPSAGNKFYNNGNNGGYSWCVNGNPTDRGCNVLANCVGYACGRFNEIIGSFKYKTLCCNAENFIERAQQAGLEISSVPTLGGIMVWQKGATLSGNDGAGHVAVVERIDSANQIYTSESGWGSSAFWNSIRRNDNGRWGLGSGYKFRGCIVNPAIGKVVASQPSAPSNNLSGYSDEQLAAMVWQGKFGNGQDRKNALGNRYAAVQALVDRGVGKGQPAPSAPAKKSVDEIAREVIRGDWGNGADRVNRLNAAGYNASEVQGRVNQLLSNNSSLRVHVVQKGETLSGIAAKYGTNWQALYAKNKGVIGSNPNIIIPGQKLTI